MDGQLRRSRMGISVGSVRRRVPHSLDILLVHARSTLVLAWVLPGLVAVGGSVVGRAFGPRALFAGALIGGVVGVVVAVLAAARFAWIAPTARWNAILGGWVGFAIAAPLAAFNLHTPVVPVASCALVGVGVLFGAGLARSG